MEKRLRVLGIIFLVCASNLHSMDKAPAYDSSSIETCLQAACQYVQQGLSTIQEDLLVKQLEDGRSIKIVKMLLGQHTVVCTVNTDGTPEAFAWSIKNQEREEWTVIKCYSSKANHIMQTLLPDLNHESQETASVFKAVCKRLPTFPPDPKWVFAYSLLKSDYGISWHIVSHEDNAIGTISQEKDHHFFASGDMLENISRLDFFMLNLACILALKKGDKWFFWKLIDNEDIKNCVTLFKPYFGQRMFLVDD